MHDKLQQAIQDRNVVLIFGTGASAALSEGADVATWIPLIESGVAYARLIGAEDEWAELTKRGLEYAARAGNMPLLVSTAGSVEAEIRHRGGDAGFGAWLAKTVGALKATNTSLARTISALPFPLLTTNYDTLLESQGRPSADWTNSSDMQAVLTGDSNSIGHLHGVWSRYESIVFGEAGYQRVLSADVAQRLQAAVSSIKSIVYVGFGAGLRDPNFGELLSWHRNAFLPSRVTHFRLCLESEVEELEREHALDQIVPVAYGSTFSDLEQFLAEMNSVVAGGAVTPAGIVRDLVAEAQAAFVEELKNEALMAEFLTAIGDRDATDVLIPPVILPVPQSEFSRAQNRLNAADRVERLDPRSVSSSSDLIVLASEEGHGLTTALKWLALESARYLGSAVPIYVPFQRCKGPRPLADAIRREALILGLISDRRAPLPPFILVLDDLSPFVDKVSDRVISELATCGAISILIGCEHGVEDEVLARIKRVGLTPEIHYIGKLSRRDIQEMSRIAAPTDYERVADQVIDVIRRDSLPRTPFTVALLLSVLSHGARYAQNASQTAILDDYVGLILGRGDPHEDARFGLDQSQREAVLSGLAMRMVEEQVGGFPEDATVTIIQEQFDRFDWDESPTEVLKSFLDRRILRRDGRHIAFARSSFLHLFAAKRASVDSDFRTFLISRPIFHSQILSDYAALIRHDQDLLRAVRDMLIGGSWRSEPSGVFEELEKTAPVPLPPPSEVTPDEEASQKAEAFDQFEDDDPPPFPTLDEDDVPEGVQLARSLELASMVLRDSDQVEDLALKEQALVDVLQHWGIFMGVVNRDSGLRDLLQMIVDSSEAFSLRKGETTEQLLDELQKIFPAAMSFGGISFTLASRKLVLAVNRAMDAGKLTGSDESTITTAFFVVALKESDWVERLAKLLHRDANIWVVRNFLVNLLIRSYLDDDAREESQDGLLELCLDIIQRSIKYDSAQAEARHRGELRQHYERVRLTQRMRTRISPASARLALDE